MVSSDFSFIQGAINAVRQPIAPIFAARRIAHRAALGFDNNAIAAVRLRRVRAYAGSGGYRCTSPQ
jgi:hypothetical protein